MLEISVSRLPPGNSQLSPLCANTGQARIPTKTIIAITLALTSSETPPSARSARRSGQGLRRGANRFVSIRRAPDRDPGPAGGAGPVAMYEAGRGAGCRTGAVISTLVNRDPLAGDDLAGSD